MHNFQSQYSFSDYSSIDNDDGNVRNSCSCCLLRFGNVDDCERRSSQTRVNRPRDEEKKRVQRLVFLLNNRDRQHFNYLRLLEGECYNCSTYKCTNHKANLGGADWCIMLFPDALAHCDSDPECGGYTMTTADWFHEKYDKNGQVAVHLTKAGQKTMPCPSPAEWSSYEKQDTTRTTPITYGKSTCEDG